MSEKKNHEKIDPNEKQSFFDVNCDSCGRNVLYPINPCDEILVCSSCYSRKTFEYTTRTGKKSLGLEDMRIIFPLKKKAKKKNALF